jgi:SET domain-containing protein
MQKRTSKYTPGNFKLRVRRSAAGKGLFTEEDIPKGVCIIEYIGKPVSEEVAIRDAGKYLFEIAPNKTIDGNIKENTARYINHSCAGNCEAIGPRGRIFIFSRKRIKAGEELTYDYGKEYFDRHIKPYGCRCAKCQRG